MDQLKEKVQMTAEKVVQFLKDAQAELKKVTWPTPKQAMASTAVVIVLVFVVSVILGIFDFALAKFINLILG
jgi:preprotein translocase subunit SecE